MKKTFAAIILLGSLTVLAFGAGTVVITETIISPVQKVKFAWTSAVGGAADGTTTYSYSGKIELLTTVPSGGGTAPSDNYDVTVVDSDGINVLAGAGADRDVANTEQVLGTSLGAVASSTLTIHVTNAGDAKQGTVYLYIR
jgi:hypothetical protein